LQVLEDFTGKDSDFGIQRLIKDKKNLERRITELETTSNNWMH
jgi:hypothetical protein